MAYRRRSKRTGDYVKSDEKTKINSETVVSGIESDGVVTTRYEIDSYNIIKSFVKDVIDADRVFIRDAKDYCGVLIDNDNRKPICLLYFKNDQKYIGLFTEGKEKKVPINSLNGLFLYEDFFKATVIEYLEKHE